MNLQNKYIMLCAVALILFPVIQSSLTGNISATDWTYRHSVWIGQYLKGDFSPIFSYPPLFHLMMMPFVFFGFPMHLFQIVFIILATFGILYMTSRLENEKALLLMSMLLATSIAFVEFASALMPQALDYLFFGFAIIFYYQNRVKLMSMMLCLAFGMHMMGIFFVLILFIHSLLAKRYRATAYLVVLGAVFFVIFGFYTNFFGNYYDEYGDMEFGWNAQAQAEWENQYLDPIWKLFAFSGYLAWVLLPYAIYKLYKRKFKISEKQILYIVWILVFFILMVASRGVWRALSYQMVPLSLLIASLIGQDEKKDYKTRFKEVFG